jgi:type IV pilus assembly protein PilZ
MASRLPLTGCIAAPMVAVVPSDADDRRYDLRAPIELRVEYKRLNSFFADYTKNISHGGTFIRTARPLDIGTDFVFKLGVPTLDEPLVLHGKVQWIVSPEDAGAEREPGMGIHFVFDDESERERVEATVEKLMIGSLGPILFEKMLGSRRKR